MLSIVNSTVDGQAITAVEEARRTSRDGLLSAFLLRKRNSRKTSSGLLMLILY